MTSPDPLAWRRSSTRAVNRDQVSHVLEPDRLQGQERSADLAEAPGCFTFESQEPPHNAHACLQTTYGALVSHL
jgi:hypothetical protein